MHKLWPFSSVCDPFVNVKLLAICKLVAGTSKAILTSITAQQHFKMLLGTFHIRQPRQRTIP
jgi:hypothetical protein